MKVKAKVRFRKTCGFTSSVGMWGIRIGKITWASKRSKSVSVLPKMARFCILCKLGNESKGKLKSSLTYM